MANQINDPNTRMMRLLQAPPDVLAQIDLILDGKAPVSTAPAPTGPLLMGMSEGAKLLGTSRTTLYRLLKAHRIDKIELLPGSFRVRRADIEAFAAGK